MLHFHLASAPNSPPKRAATVREQTGEVNKRKLDPANSGVCTRHPSPQPTGQVRRDHNTIGIRDFRCVNAHRLHRLLRNRCACKSRKSLFRIQSNRLYCSLPSIALPCPEFPPIHVGLARFVESSLCGQCDSRIGIPDIKVGCSSRRTAVGLPASCAAGQLGCPAIHL
jgi:hypothetical protein